MASEDRDQEQHEVEERPQRRREWSGGVRSVIVPVLIVAAIIGVLWYVTATDFSLLAGGSEATDQVPADPPDNRTGRAAAPEEGRMAPDFQLQTLDGDTVRLSDLRGRPVLINFWASWCPPCREEMPLLVDAYDRYRDQGLVILGVNVKETEAQARSFAEEFGMEFPVALDFRGEAADRYRSYQFPESYFIDGEGVIRSIAIGAMDAEELESRLKTILEPQGE